MDRVRADDVAVLIMPDDHGLQLVCWQVFPSRRTEGDIEGPTFEQQRAARDLEGWVALSETEKSW